MSSPLFPSLCCKQFRLDDYPGVRDRFNKCISKFGIKYYLLCPEIATRPHLQGILFFEEKLGSNTLQNFRNFWTSWYKTKHQPPSGIKKWQPYSFTNAKKPATLISYVSKEYDETTCITNLTKDQIATVTKWQTKKERKQLVWADLVKKMNEFINSEREINDDNFIIEFTRLHRQIFKRLPFSKNLYYRCAMECGYVTEIEYAALLNVNFNMIRSLQPIKVVKNDQLIKDFNEFKKFKKRENVKHHYYTRNNCQFFPPSGP